MSSEKKQLIIKLHEFIKQLILLSEKHAIEERIRLQSIIEESEALGYIIRVMAYDEGLKPDAETDFSDKNMIKAFNCLREAFFNIAEVFCLGIKDNIVSIMKPFDDKECIKEVVPDYYTNIRQEINTLSIDVSEDRVAIKKIMMDETGISKIAKYMERFQEILQYYKRIVASEPSLQEAHNKLKKRKSEKSRSKIILIVLSCVLSCVLTGILAFLVGLNLKSPKSKPETQSQNFVTTTSEDEITTDDPNKKEAVKSVAVKKDSK